jgi:hypothetical protein
MWKYWVSAGQASARHGGKHGANLLGHKLATATLSSCSCFEGKQRKE